MKNSRLKQNWYILLIFVLSAAFIFASSFYSKNLAIAGGVGLFFLILTYLIARRSWRRDYFNALNLLSEKLSDSEKNALDNMALPAVLCSSDGSIIWYNSHFSAEFADKEKDSVLLQTYIGEKNVNDLFVKGKTFSEVDKRFFNVYSSSVKIKN